MNADLAPVGWAVPTNSILWTLTARHALTQSHEAAEDITSLPPRKRAKQAVIGGKAIRDLLLLAEPRIPGTILPSRLSVTALEVEK
jgi:hypothetical protein